LAQSGAIIDYLIDTYDTAHKLSYASGPEKYQTRVWEHFQMSGQGPYFGQLIWFTRYHPEKVQSALDRYAKEVRRVTGVIDAHLKKQKTEYLVGDKLTYADLMFVPWTNSIAGLPAGSVDLSGFEAFDAWFARLASRPSVQKIKQAKVDALATANH
jgi:glutathione S-transferase